MVNQFQQTHRLRLLVAGVLVGAAISVPLGAYAMSDNSSTQAPLPATVLADLKSPTVTITSYNTASTTPDISGTFDDNIGVAKLTATIDGHSYTNEVNINHDSKTWTLPGSSLVAPLTAGTNYVVMVTAKDAAGNTGNGSGIVQITLPAPPPATPEKTEPTETPLDQNAPVEDLQTAVAIAAQEHDSEVISAKLVLMNNEKVYKVTFSDGWRIYVRASNGDIVVIKDWFDNSQPIHNYAKNAWVKQHGWWKPTAAQYIKYSNTFVQQNNWNITYNFYYSAPSPDTVSTPAPSTSEPSTTSAPDKLTVSTDKTEKSGASTSTPAKTTTPNPRPSNNHTPSSSHKSSQSRH